MEFSLDNLIKKKVGSFTLVFDAYSELTAKHAKNHPSLKKTGAKILWGIDDEKALEQWHLGLHFKEARYFTAYHGIDQLDFLTRVMFKMSHHISIAKKAHRILIYQVE